MRSFSCSTRWLAVTLSSNALIKSLSSGAEQLTGYSAQELAGKPIIHILEDNTAFEVPQILKTATEWGAWEGNIVHKMRGGRRLDAHGIVTSLAGKGNEADGFILLSSLNPSLVLNDSENSAVTGIADTLRMYAHDLNNPLAVIMGFTQLLMVNENCQGQMRQDLDKLYSELKRVIQTVEQLHGYAHSLYPKRDLQNESGIRHA
jgi:nitrogen-specific signal transduction histidine kinase